MGSIFTILIVMIVLDVTYTKIYESSFPRSKFQYLRSLGNKKVDYIFIGSSRVEYGIVPNIIEKKTGKSAVNLGFQAAKLGDIYTLLQLVKEYNIQYETIFIQVDYIYNIKDGHSNIFEYQMMPFIRDNGITKSYSDKYGVHSIANYYLPFFRYCSNDFKLGFREIFSNIVQKETNVILQKGYISRLGNATELTGALPKVLLDKNETLDSIQFFIKQNKMKVVFYCAPFCKNNQNKDFTAKLKFKIPGLQDFSQVLTDDQLFIDCNHLNDNGAKRFTEIFAEEVLMK
ncbi:hypothetical protein [Flavobacterium sp.]|uniref:hypothetical protein n=1 Tax=Flavobacterium sp. TaxID=239 RepID=UPI00286E060C|nr:hypothetical protein [Flavobacterium sp.]